MASVAISLGSLDDQEEVPTELRLTWLLDHSQEVPAIQFPADEAEYLGGARALPQKSPQGGA